MAGNTNPATKKFFFPFLRLRPTLRFAAPFQDAIYHIIRYFYFSHPPRPVAPSDAWRHPAPQAPSRIAAPVVAASRYATFYVVQCTSLRISSRGIKDRRSLTFPLLENARPVAPSRPYGRSPRAPSSASLTDVRCCAWRILHGLSTHRIATLTGSGGMGLLSRLSSPSDSRRSIERYICWSRTEV